MIKVATIKATYASPDYEDYVDDSPVDEEHREEHLTFKELVQLMKAYTETSCCPARGDTREWLSYSTTCYIDGSLIEYSMHYDRNLPRSAKYWRKAMKAAGFIK